MAHNNYFRVRDGPVILNKIHKYGKVQNLMSYININTLMDKHNQLSGNKATGIDNITKNIYDKNLEQNLDNLLNRMKRLEYYPLPARRTFIPKFNGKLRALGIPSYEDKLVQGVMADILSVIYEPIFLDCSFGFRPNRNCHEALKKINYIISNNNTYYIVETDIKCFFDNVNHQYLLNFISSTINDKRFITYIKRFLKSGVMQNTKKLNTKRGTPQGGLISPVLANIYLHYVLDEWFEKHIKAKYNNCYLIRYCDDFIACFQNIDEARLFYQELLLRFKQYELELEASKTKIVNLNNTSILESFDFLGFTISKIQNEFKYNGLSFTTSNKKLQLKKEEINNLIKKHRHSNNMISLINQLNLKLNGFYNYYNVYTNQHCLNEIYNYTLQQLQNILNFDVNESNLFLVKPNVSNSKSL